MLNFDSKLNKKLVQPPLPINNPVHQNLHRANPFNSASSFTNVQYTTDVFNFFKERLAVYYTLANCTQLALLNLIS